MYAIPGNLSLGERLYEEVSGKILEENRAKRLKKLVPAQLSGSEIKYYLNRLMWLDAAACLSPGGPIVIVSRKNKDSASSLSISSGILLGTPLERRENVVGIPTSAYFEQRGPGENIECKKGNLPLPENFLLNTTDGFLFWRVSIDVGKVGVQEGIVSSAKEHAERIRLIVRRMCTDCVG